MITVYSSEGCKQCDAAKDYLARKGAQFEVKLVDQDEEALKHIVSLGYKGIPVIEKNGESFVGFNPVRLDEYIDAK